jgi:hypothetical protein
MTLTLLPAQPPEPVPVYALFARIEELPYYLSALARAAFNRAGTTADHLLTLAEYCDQVAAECRVRDVRGMLEPEAVAWLQLAGILRDCAPHRPHPPRLPIGAEEADAGLRRRVQAAGIATAGEGRSP